MVAKTSTRNSRVEAEKKIGTILSETEADWRVNLARHPLKTHQSVEFSAKIGFLSHTVEVAPISEQSWAVQWKTEVDDEPKRVGTPTTSVIDALDKAHQQMHHLEP